MTTEEWKQSNVEAEPRKCAAGKSPFHCLSFFLQPLGRRKFVATTSAKQWLMQVGYMWRFNPGFNRALAAATTASITLTVIRRFTARWLLLDDKLVAISGRACQAVFRTFIKPLLLDLVVNRRGIYELKTVSALTPAHFAQLLNFLFLTNAARAKLINFRRASVESQFVNSALELGAHHPLRLRKLAAPSPLKALHWVNIARHQLTLSTINL